MMRRVTIKPVNYFCIFSFYFLVNIFSPTKVSLLPCIKKPICVNQCRNQVFKSHGIMVFQCLHRTRCHAAPTYSDRHLGKVSQKLPTSLSPSFPYSILLFFISFSFVSFLQFFLLSSFFLFYFTSFFFPSFLSFFYSSLFHFFIFSSSFLPFFFLVLLPFFSVSFFPLSSSFPV